VAIDDPILRRAVERRDELAQELQKIKDFISTYQSIANSLRLDTKNITGTLPDLFDDALNPAPATIDPQEREAEVADAAEARRTRVTGNPKPADVIAAAVTLIGDVGRPLTRRQIHRGLKNRGILVKGTDPIKTLGTTLWRSGGDYLEQIEGRGYWLKGEPVPPLPDIASIDLDELLDDHPDLRE